MATSDRFNVLIVDPDSASRNRLKQVALALTTFQKVQQSTNLNDALIRGESSHELYDVIVMSYLFPTEEINKFIKDAKKTKQGSEWAFVTVLRSADQQNEIIANSVISGIDGFLFEPYSADNLREMAELTAKVKKQNSDKRKRIAMRILLTEVAGHVDALAFYRSKGKESASATKKMNDACDRLGNFKNENFELYVDEMINVFGSMPPPANASYTGVSLRVKKRLEEKRLAQLEAEYENT